MKLRMGTRQSALAQAQSAWVVRQLQMREPGLEIETVFITTSGDRGIRPPVGQPLKAMFTKELEEALLDGRIDFAVHSMKDLGTPLPDGLELGAIPEREDPRDAFICPRGFLFCNLPEGARIGTSAVRRTAQLKHVRPDITIVPLRGNVDTRLKKVLDQEMDAIVVALAGLRRLGRTDVVTETLSAALILPPAGQGALAVEIRRNDPEVRACIEKIHHLESGICVDAERVFLNELGGGCQTPIGVYARVERGRLIMSGAVLDPEGKRQLRREVEGTTWEGDALALQLAGQMFASGARDLLG